MRAGGDEDDAALDPGRRRRAHELVRELVHEEKVREMIDREVSLDAVLGEVEERLRDDPRGAQDAVQRHRERAERGRERADGSHAREVARQDDDLRGGALEVSGRFDDSKPNAPLTARAEMKNFRLLNAPLMAQILSIASLSGPLTLLDGEGLAFIRLELPFVRSDTSIEIGKARAYGNAIGITTEGRVDLAADKIELAGTVVPAYSVNRVIGAIPLVGQLLTGGQGEGVFAVTYRVSGPLDKPVITVNPLSALAPGFLRNLFDIFDSPPSGPSAPASPAPAPPETTAPAATPN